MGPILARGRAADGKGLDGWRVLRIKTLLIFGRNAPIFSALALGVRLGDWPMRERALLVSGAIVSTWAISVTKQYLDPDRVAGFRTQCPGVLAERRSGLWLSAPWQLWDRWAVGVGLAAVIVRVQYGVLGNASFFDKTRVALAYGGALAIIAPLVLMGLRASLGLPTMTALLTTLGLTLALSPVLAYLNYTMGTDDATVG